MIHLKLITAILSCCLKSCDCDSFLWAPREICMLFLGNIFLQTFDAKNNLMKKYYNENNVLFLSRWWLQFHLVWLWCKDLRYFLPSRFPVSFFLLFLRSSSRRRSSGTHVMKTLTIATAEPIQELVPVLPLRQNWFQWNQLQLTTLPFSTWVDWLMAGFPKLWAFCSFFCALQPKPLLWWFLFC